MPPRSTPRRLVADTANRQLNRVGLVMVRTETLGTLRAEIASLEGRLASSTADGERLHDDLAAARAVADECKTISEQLAETQAELDAQTARCAALEREHDLWRSRAAARLPASGFALATEHPIATDSPDHIHPAGTINDNSRCPRFNEKLYTLFAPPASILDLGCAGGGFVEDCVFDGHEGVGLEGSDLSRRARRAAWGTIGDRLFTCDCVKPYTITRHGQPYQFDVVTAWEFMEHIRTSDLDGLFENIMRHLKPSGVFIASIACFAEGPRHQTVESPAWWRAKLAEYGLEFDAERTEFFGRDFVRGFITGWGAPLAPELIAKHVTGVFRRAA